MSEVSLFLRRLNSQYDILAENSQYNKVQRKENVWKIKLKEKKKTTSRKKKTLESIKGHEKYNTRLYSTLILRIEDIIYISIIIIYMTFDNTYEARKNSTLWM